MIQLYFGETNITFKVNGNTPYPVKVVLLMILNISSIFSDHVPTLAVLFPFSTLRWAHKLQEMDESLEISIPPSTSVMALSDHRGATAHRFPEDGKLKRVQFAMNKILLSLALQMELEYQVKVLSQLWECHPVLVSSCCNILEGKSLLHLKHGCKAYPGVRCLNSKSRIYALKRLSRFKKDMRSA